MTEEKDSGELEKPPAVFDIDKIYWDGNGNLRHGMSIVCSYIRHRMRIKACQQVGQREIEMKN
jgi:hypothetical protein